MGERKSKMGNGKSKMVDLSSIKEKHNKQEKKFCQGLIGSGKLFQE